jgi:hypothetical protein
MAAAPAAPPHRRVGLRCRHRAHARCGVGPAGRSRQPDIRPGGADRVGHDQGRTPATCQRTAPDAVRPGTFRRMNSGPACRLAAVRGAVGRGRRSTMVPPGIQAAPTDPPSWCPGPRAVRRRSLDRRSVACPGPHGQVGRGQSWARARWAVRHVAAPPSARGQGAVKTSERWPSEARRRWLAPGTFRPSSTLRPSRSPRVEGQRRLRRPGLAPRPRRRRPPLAASPPATCRRRSARHRRWSRCCPAAAHRVRGGRWHLRAIRTV